MNNFYEVNTESPCCYNCKYADKGMSQIMLTCQSKDAWYNPSAVEPIGTCKYFEKKETNNGTAKAD